MAATDGVDASDPLDGDVGAIDTIDYQPDLEPLDMTKGEKLRATALMLAVKWAEHTATKFTPTAVGTVVDAAGRFEAFLTAKKP